MSEELTQDQPEVNTTEAAPVEATDTTAPAEADVVAEQPAEAAEATGEQSVAA